MEGWLAGKCRRKIVHFGSCGTVAEHGLRLNRFPRATGAAAVCGYRKDVDWMQSTAFEVLLFNELQQVPFTPTGLRRAKANVQKLARGLVNKLSFRMRVAS